MNFRKTAFFLVSLFSAALLLVMLPASLCALESSELKELGSEVDPMVLVITPESPESIAPGRPWLKMALKKYFLDLRYSLTASRLEDIADNMLVEHRASLKDKDAESFFSSPMMDDPPSDSFFKKLVNETDASLIVWSRLKGYKAKRSHDETWTRFSSAEKYSWLDLLVNPDRIGGKLYCRVGARIVVWDKNQGKVCDELSVVNQKTSFFGSFRSRMEGLRQAIRRVIQKALDDKFE